MGYQALLFCPDEKTARTVTQVLGDLEFSVETCAEPFAAVARTDDGIVEAMELKTDRSKGAPAMPFFLAVQFHPERLVKHPEHQAIFSGFVNACGGESGAEPETSSRRSVAEKQT